MKIPAVLRSKTIQVKNRTGEGAYGPVHAAERTVKCQLDWKRRMVRGSNGNDVITTATLRFDPAENIPVESLITIDGTPYTAIQSGKPEDLTGPQFLEVMVG